ncbi:GMC family oxidoreductase [Pseudoxanthomonas sp.]|uniref:GMC family oxidoreductase n=1 Tax=Pseudoxanthomonas sp. TaxID=1871049 RepID=UPI0026108F75|nr:GMC family oxidoreductase [Pseudoxanthomonas sp.]WDS37309.1 MAG: GMC family oxidoreductase [Pseudoxanthomonas sp.]
MSDASKSLSADVVIVGAGTAGGAAAVKLLAQGLSVLMLEAGGPLDQAELVSNYRAGAYKNNHMAPYPMQPWAPHPNFIPHDNGYLIQKGPAPYTAQYIRGVGGTTWHWAGQAWRLIPNDMRLQSLYGIATDWPISYEELEPFYMEAEREMGVSGGGPLAGGDYGSPRSAPYPMDVLPLSYGFERLRQRYDSLDLKVVPGPQARNSTVYDNRPACCGNNNCMPVCPIGAQYNGSMSVRRAQKMGLHLVPNAVVFKIETGADNQVQAVHYIDQHKQVHRVTGKHFLLTANAMETVKILLMSKDGRNPNGVANATDQVGRNLMDHPASAAEYLADEPLYLGRGPMCPGSINNTRDGDFRGERSAIRIDVHNDNPTRYLTEKYVTQGYYGNELNDKIKHDAERFVLLKSMFEMLPDPENRIVLSDQKDAWGIPKMEVHYRFPEYVHKGYDVCRDLFEQAVRATGGTQAKYSDRGTYTNSQHITGTLRMGSDPNTSVCNKLAQAHDHKNLFFGGTGVMPTASTVNSTLTGVSLSLLAADSIIKAAA